MTPSFARRSPMALLAIVAVVSCASHVAADTQSVQSGAWNDPDTWSGGFLPGLGDEVTISAGHTVHFPPSQDYTVELDENLIVYGTLQMRPQQTGNPYYEHVLRFVNVDEGDFVGGGMDPASSDVGLWVRGDGVLDIEGTPKRGWARAVDDVVAGAQSVELDHVPTGWRPGDTIVLVPTEHPSVGNRSWNGFEERTIEQVGGSTVYFSPALRHDHPAVTDPFTDEIYTAEVLNLSRNVRIEGTGNGSASPSGNGRAHINIRSASPQSIRYAELVLLGPRQPSGRYTDGVLGRYPLHFHHNGDGSRGSLVEGVVVHRSGNRAFVPHASHGITFRDTIAYDGWEDQYWWDPGGANASDDVLWDRAACGLVKDDPAHRGFILTCYNHVDGQNPILRDSVAVGVQGNSDSSGFLWNNGSQGVWGFTGNVSHNNKRNGIRVWQNTSGAHTVVDFSGYHNGFFGIRQGAYGNNYQYTDVRLWENGSGSLELQAMPRNNVVLRPDGYSMAFENFRGGGTLRLSDHQRVGWVPVLFKDCSFPGVIVNEIGAEEGHYDFVNCQDNDDGTPLEPNDFTLTKMLPGMVIRVQRADGTAFQIDHTGKVTTISAFYDTDGGGGGDTEAPSAPSGLTAMVVSSNQLDLSWTASTDNVGVTGYRIYRDDSLVATVSGTSHSDTGLSASTTYTYEVAAIDAADNESARSSSVSATTLADDTDAGDDGSTDDGSTDDGSTDDGSTDDGSTDDGSTDDGSTDDGSTDDGSTDDGSTNDGTDDGDTGGDDSLIHWDGPQEFDGVDDRIDMSPLDVSGSEITIAARFTADTFACRTCPSRDGRLVSKATGVQSGEHWWMLSTIAFNSSERLRFRLKTGTTTSTLIASSGNLQAGTSHHAAAVYDGSQMRLYLDGVLVGSTSKSGNVAADPNVLAWIGGNPNGSNFWDGTISDVKIYDRALSASEITALHAGG